MLQSSFLIIFPILHQVWYSNPALRDWLKEHADASQMDKLKWMYYLINKSPWCVLLILLQLCSHVILYIIT
jgi:hypothetical protein